MLTLGRRIGESIIFEYEGKLLELQYYRYTDEYGYTFHIYLNNHFEAEFRFKARKHTIDFIEQTTPFKFIIDDPKISQQKNERRVTIDCPRYVVIRRKEIKNFKKGVA